MAARQAVNFLKRIKNSARPVHLEVYGECLNFKAGNWQGTLS
jgi:hypothetical protein